jgi:hypothetical protein
VAGCCEHGDELSDYIKCMEPCKKACGACSWLLRRLLACNVCLGNRTSRGGVGGMPASWPGGPGFKFRFVDGLCRDLAWFICYCLQANSGIVPLNRNHPLQFINFTMILNYKFMWIHPLIIRNKFVRGLIGPSFWRLRCEMAGNATTGCGNRMWR